MKTLYLECGMGAAGDMLTAALLELMPDPDAVVAELNGLGIPGVQFSKEAMSKCGIGGTHMTVKVHGEEESEEMFHHHHEHHDHSHEQEHDHESACHEHHHTNMSTPTSIPISMKITSTPMNTPTSTVMMVTRIIITAVSMTLSISSVVI